MSFADNLKNLMTDRSLNAREVSEATNIPRSTISEWLNGREPTFNNSLLELSHFFGVSVEYLLTGKEPEGKIIKSIISEMEKHFSEIHSGIYRVRVEKLNK